MASNTVRTTASASCLEISAHKARRSTRRARVIAKAFLLFGHGAQGVAGTHPDRTVAILIARVQRSAMTDPWRDRRSFSDTEKPCARSWASDFAGTALLRSLRDPRFEELVGGLHHVSRLEIRVGHVFRQLDRRVEGDAKLGLPQVLDAHGHERTAIFDGEARGHQGRLGRLAKERQRCPCADPLVDQHAKGTARLKLLNQWAHAGVLRNEAAAQGAAVSLHHPVDHRVALGRIDHRQRHSHPRGRGGRDLPVADMARHEHERLTLRMVTLDLGLTIKSMCSPNLRSAMVPEMRVLRQCRAEAFPGTPGQSIDLAPGGLR